MMKFSSCNDRNSHKWFGKTRFWVKHSDSTNLHQERLKLNDDLEKQISYFFPHQKLGTKSSCCLNVWLRNVFYQIILFNCDFFSLTDDENWYYQLLSMYLIYLGLLYFLFCKFSQGMTFKIGWKITDFF